MAVRGSPAKGVGSAKGREGSNPSFSANIKERPRASLLCWLCNSEGFEAANRKSNGVAFSAAGFERSETGRGVSGL